MLNDLIPAGPVSARTSVRRTTGRRPKENALVVVITTSSRFLLESLILAQDERWRRA